MQNRIQGTTMPVLEFMLGPNDAIISEAGELSWMSQSIQMTTHTQMGGGGGVFGALKRVAGGGSLCMTEYRAMGAPGEVAFAAKLPGHIVPVDVGPGREYMVHRHGFLCATPAIQLSVGFQQSLGAGIFGGDGFLLQKISGQGMAWLVSPVQGKTRRQRVQRTRASSPCRWISFRFPARSWRSSTFWVTNVNRPANRSASSARAIWAALGLTVASWLRRIL